jgi:hypothetical protein
MEATLATTGWPLRSALAGALGTAITLLGGVALGFGAGQLVTNALPVHLHDPVQIGLSATVGLALLALGGALWGVWMGLLAGYPAHRRMAWAGALGFGPITVLLAVLLLLFELSGLERYALALPVHRLFTILFVPTAFLIAGVGSLAIGLGLNDPRLAWRMAWRAGLAGAVTFLIVNLILDALGWRVGGPNAEERATMLTVMFSGDLAAALTAGAIVGWMVTRAHARAS